MFHLSVQPQKSILLFSTTYTLYNTTKQTKNNDNQLNNQWRNDANDQQQLAIKTLYNKLS